MFNTVCFAILTLYACHHLFEDPSLGNTVCLLPSTILGEGQGGTMREGHTKPFTPWPQTQAPSAGSLDVSSGPSLIRIFPDQIHWELST